MSDNFLGEIRAVSFGYAPKGWLPCNGQLLSIAQNTALFSLLGTTYGGDGRTSFGLPDLRGRVPTHAGATNPVFSLGQTGGETAHTLTVNETPAHLHTMMVSTDATGGTYIPTGTFVGPAPASFALPTVALSPLPAAAVSTVGSSQPHANMMPYMPLNFVIATQGIFPSRN